MADGLFNISKGAFAEKIRDTAANTHIILLETGQTETDLVDHEDIAALLAAAPIEANFTNYGRKTDIAGESLTVDHGNERVDYDIPDQTWTSAGNGLNESLVKLLSAYEESAGDANLIPMSHHDFVVTTDGSDLTAQINAAGLIRAS
jgi:hypothetical protein